MEIDIIKDLWNAENPTETPEISLEKQKEIRMPLEKIRFEMKKYYNLTIFGFILWVASMFFIFENPPKATVVKVVLLFIIYIIITIYYFKKFNILYKKLVSQHKLTKIYIDELRFELRLNLNELRSYLLFSLPMIFAEFLIIIPSNTFADENKLVKLFCILIILLPYFIYTQRRKIKRAFELPISDLEIILKDLRE